MKKFTLPVAYPPQYFHPKSMLRDEVKNKLPKLAIIFSLIKANSLRNNGLFKKYLMQSKGNRIVKLGSLFFTSSPRAFIQQILLFLCLFSTPKILPAQPDLETTVPANYTATSGTLSMSSDHYRLGAQSLRWDWVGGDTLKITGLNMVDAFTWGLNTFSTWVHNETPLVDTIKFQFINPTNVVQFRFNYGLNFSGWRWAVQSYRFDMPKGIGPSWAVKAINIVAPTTGSGTLFFDDFNYVRTTISASADDQMPYLPNNRRYVEYTTTPLFAATTPTAQELADLNLIRTRFLPPVAAPSAAQITATNTTYNTWNIVVSGNQIKGKIITAPDQIGAMMDIYGRDWRVNRTEASRQKGENLMRLLLDGGMAGGSLSWGAGGSSGYAHRIFFTALKQFTTNSAFPPDLNTKIKNWLYWSGGLGLGWLPKDQRNGRYDTDGIHVLYDFYFNAVFFSNTDAEAVQMLKCLKGYFEGFCQGHRGTSDGPKIDGPGFHHAAHHNAYMYAFSTFSGVLLSRLHQTSFQIDAPSYNFFRSVVIALDVSKNGGQYGNSLSGRAPFAVTGGLNAGEMSTLANIGGYILGKPYDPILAAHRNWRFGTDPAFSATPPSVPTGFWQMNYSPLGVYRHGTWVADIRGLTSYFWGTEIYTGSNRYGLYQSYGAVEVIYNGGFNSSGFKAQGWNWNMPPGTTTVHLPYNLLNPSGDRFDEYNSVPFSGNLRFNEIEDSMGLQHGTHGVFGMKLVQRGFTNNTGLKARKSVFCVNGMMICLGTNISATSTLGSTATNLFQGFLTTPATATSIDGAIETTLPTNNTLSSTAHHWLRDAFGTAYFVYSGSGDVIVERKSQTTPNQDASGNTSTADFATAYINHGTAPTNGKYEYVIAPNKTEAELNLLKDTLGQVNLKPYDIRKQDSTAHIVYFKKDSIEGSVFFQANTLIDTGRVLSNSQPTLFMSQKKGDTLQVTLTNPDVNLVNSTSIEKNIVVVLRGEWGTLTKDSRASKSTIKNGTTEITFKTIDGLPIDATLLQTTELKLEVVPKIGRGVSTGSATATATGGTGNYTFTWSSGATGTQALNLPEGTYTVTVNDGLQTVSKTFNMKDCLIQEGIID
jgi:chondroitin-sulfate-ABC endolyase/exolyase